MLAREIADPDENLLKKQVHNETVLVIGAGGSIGSEICRQVLRRYPKTLLLLEHDEYALYSIHQELLHQLHRTTRIEKEDVENVTYSIPRIIPLLGSIQDSKRLTELMSTWKPEVVYQVAAYKHVPIVEHNPSEGIKNNVFGTLATAKVAIEQEISNFVLISTDKAVCPTNVMGCSKRLGEMVLQALAAEQNVTFQLPWEPESQIQRKTRFSIVRFGNVLGSSGSVVPLFREQIKKKGPVTITDSEVTRYFMTISEAAQLVMQAGAMSSDNLAEVFVLDMGEPVKVYDLAKRMIELSGLRVKNDNCPEGDIEINIIGLRPGEKLYEELLIGNNSQVTQHPGILKANEEYISWTELQPYLKSLYYHARNNDAEEIRKLLQKLVYGYIPDEKLVDWVFMEHNNYK